MQTSGKSRRENADSHPHYCHPRACGASSTPRPLGSSTASGILITRFRGCDKRKLFDIRIGNRSLVIASSGSDDAILSFFAGLWIASLRSQ